MIPLAPLACLRASLPGYFAPGATPIRSRRSATGSADARLHVADWRRCATSYQHASPSSTPPHVPCLAQGPPKVPRSGPAHSSTPLQTRQQARKRVADQRLRVAGQWLSPERELAADRRRRALHGVHRGLIHSPAAAVALGKAPTPPSRLHFPHQLRIAPLHPRRNALNPPVVADRRPRVADQRPRVVDRRPRVADRRPRVVLRRLRTSV